MKGFAYPVDGRKDAAAVDDPEENAVFAGEVGDDDPDQDHYNAVDGCGEKKDPGKDKRPAEEVSGDAKPEGWGVGLHAKVAGQEENADKQDDHPDNPRDEANQDDLEGGLHQCPVSGIRQT